MSQSQNNSPNSSQPTSPMPQPERVKSAPVKRVNIVKKTESQKRAESNARKLTIENAELETENMRLRVEMENKDDAIKQLQEFSLADAETLEVLNGRIADLESALTQQKQKSAKTTKAKKYQGIRIKKTDMPTYDKAALDTQKPDGWSEPRPGFNCFTYGIPLRDDGSLIDTGYIYNGLRWTTDEFDTAVAECLKRADIKSLHYEKGYWHAKTGDIIRGKMTKDGICGRVFIKGESYDDKANKAQQKDSLHGGEQNLKQTLTRWGEIQGDMGRTDFTEHFKSVRFPAEESIYDAPWAEGNGPDAAAEAEAEEEDNSSFIMGYGPDEEQPQLNSDSE